MYRTVPNVIEPKYTGLCEIKTTAIEYKGLKFLITNCPTDLMLSKFCAVLREHGVSHLVRVCEVGELLYDPEGLTRREIILKALPVEDGTFPSVSTVREWLNYVDFVFKESPEACLGVHCVTGLGRSPLMVGLTLVELGMDNEAAVNLLRAKKRGCLNAKQVVYLRQYKARSRLSLLRNKKLCFLM